MRLSVLIPSIPSRHEFLSRILGILGPQLTADVQILINMDACSQTVGEKRNALLHAAEGEYCSFVDDDDVVSESYIAEMLYGISLGMDAVCIRGDVTRDGFPFGTFVDTPYQVSQNIQQGDGTFLCLRGTQHLDAIKREIALEARFESRNFAEDSRWTAALEKTKLIQSWHLIEKPLYTYCWRTDKPRPRQVAVISSRI